ncbi:MAG TPA: hypothetical protein VLS90_16575 [Thermodesulfobacteriota bacterium]|nr:hypothetical protein [Thermodesulfobacteriota bacterium]
MQGFLYLLFKQRNTDEKWTREEKRELKDHLKRLSLYVPMIVVFLLPGGSLMLPVFAEVLDRRSARRLQESRAAYALQKAGAAGSGPAFK